MFSFTMFDMADGKIAKSDTMLQSNASSSGLAGSLSSDDVPNPTEGHSHDLKRNYSLWSILGAGFSLTNSWVGPRQIGMSPLG